MKSVSVTTLLLVAAAATLSSPATSADITTAPTVVFKADRAQYLSTESASGTLTIVNSTTEQIGYSPPSVTFLIREPDGSVREQHWIMAVSRPFRTVWIQPGRSQQFSIPLPNCEVVLDPCSERIALKLQLAGNNKPIQPITTSEISYTFVPDPTVTYRVDGLRLNRPLFLVQEKTQESIARFLDADPLDGARGVSNDNTAPAAEALIGARAITSIPDRFGRVPTTSQHLGNRMDYVGPPSLSVTIAADRPEIFALVGLKKERCERLGYDCEAVAVVLAVQRARLLAHALGVGVRYISLVALYREESWVGQDTIVPLGIGMTMTGETLAAWRRLPTPTPQPSSGFGTIGVFPARSMPMPFMANRRTPAPDPVPIVVPDDATTVTGLGRATQALTADELRVDISVAESDSNSTPSPNLPDPRAVAHLLRTKSEVVDAAGQAQGVGQLPAVYDVLLKTYDRATIDRLVAKIRHAYRAVPIGLRYVTSPAISNCDRAYAASAQAAMQDALGKALNAQRRLRRLVLAVAYPITGAQQCEPGAQLTAVDWTYNNRLELPPDRTVMVGASVKLVFRTSK